VAETAVMEEFEALLEESFTEKTPKVKSVVKGKVLSLDAGQAVVDIGFKVEGCIDLKEFNGPSGPEEIEVGDEIDVYLDSVEDGRGLAVISRERARREEAWDRLQKAFDKQEKVEGKIFNKVKGGYTVDLGGAVAFLPGSQVDVRPVRDMEALMGINHEFMILKMDRPRNNIVVSRRVILEENRAEQRAEVVNRLQDGDVVEGIVKNVTDYGAFVDLGGVDGLLHVTDMAWKRVAHPTDVVSIGEKIQVKIIKVVRETQRISLSIKQLLEDPWLTVSDKYPKDTRHIGHVTNITDYGAFVELEPGVEGLIHVSEMSWTKKNIHPGKIVSTSQQVEVMVLDIDWQRRRIALGLKQIEQNPWEAFAEDYPIGTRVTGRIRNIADFGMFIGLSHDIDGMIHLSDLSWERSGAAALKEYKKGDEVEAVVTEVDVANQRVNLSVKGLSNDPFQQATSGLAKKSIVKVEVSGVQNNGIEVLCNGYKCFIRRGDLSRDRNEQRTENFHIGQEIEAMVTAIDRSARKIGLSISEIEAEETRQALSQYGSSDSGFALGDVLGDALDMTPERGDGEEASETRQTGKEGTSTNTEAKAAEPKKATAAGKSKTADGQDVKDGDEGPKE